MNKKGLVKKRFGRLDYIVVETTTPETIYGRSLVSGKTTGIPKEYTETVKTVTMKTTVAVMQRAIFNPRCVITHPATKKWQKILTEDIEVICLWTEYPKKRVYLKVINSAIKRVRTMRTTFDEIRIEVEYLSHE